MQSAAVRVGIGGAAVVGVAFGMARYAYGLTLPEVRAEFGLSELLLGAVASGTFAGYLVGLLAVPRLSARRGPRAPTTVGGVCGAVGCATVALSPSPGVLAAGAVLAGSAAGFVWAPWSDIAARVVPPVRRPAVLSGITTGTSAGLVALAGAGLLAASGSWRWVWGTTALLAAAAVALDLRTVPRLPPPPRAAGDPARSVLRRETALPVIHAVLYSAATTVWFTWATDVARDGGLGAAAAALLFAVVGVGGLVALETGRLTAAVGPATVAAASVALSGVALVLLALGRSSLPLLLLSALLLGVGYMTGSAVLAVWTAEVVPDRPGDGFTATLVAGAVAAVAAPALTGALVPALGLPRALLLVGAVSAVGAAGVLVAGRRRTAAAAAG